MLLKFQNNVFSKPGHVIKVDHTQICYDFLTVFVEGLPGIKVNSGIVVYFTVKLRAYG